MVHRRGDVDLLEDSEQLHNIPMRIKVGIKPAQAQYAEQNVIKSYAAYDGTAVPAMGASKPGSAALPPAETKAEKSPEPAAGKKTPPWRK